MVEKKGALELSIGTIVVIVIAMTMLILGLVLVRTIFTGSTESVKTLNEKVQNEISALFATEGADVVIKLGEGQTAKIKPNDEAFGIAVGARTSDDSSVGDRNRLQYKLILDTTTQNNCVSKIGARKTEDLFITRLNQFNPFDEWDGSVAFALVEIRIPKGTGTCTQKILVDVKDTQTNEAIGGNFFKIDILKSGLFG